MKSSAKTAPMRLPQARDISGLLADVVANMIEAHLRLEPKSSDESSHDQSKENDLLHPLNTEDTSHDIGQNHNDTFGEDGLCLSTSVEHGASAQSS